MTRDAELTDVIYNAAEQAFEAVVTLTTANGRMRYATSFPAPITTDPDIAAQGLEKQARRMHELNTGMRAYAARRVDLPTRLPRRTAPERWMDTIFARARAA